jgi:hypothetical protein
MGLEIGSWTLKLIIFSAKLMDDETNNSQFTEPSQKE